MILRDYQQEIFDDAWSQSSNDLVQLDTGAGKTPIEAALFAKAECALLIAHRNVLMVQCSTMVARFGVSHDTISSEFTRRRCMAAHRPTGRNHIQRGHPDKLVASIDSLVSHHRRSRLTLDRFRPWLILIDEAHHVVHDNKWGQLCEIFPNARFVGFTATPGRMDGASLSVRNGGLFDRLVQCAWLRDNSIKKLIAAGRLCGYSLYTPPSGLNRIISRSEVEIADSPVNAYQCYMSGQQAIVMCPAIKNAREIAGQFRDAGISAASISSDMAATDVWRAIDEFSSGRINVLCNVDMVGEGFDVPGVVGLIIARVTQSFIMYRQWIGRILRPAPGKIQAIIVDLVGAISLHGEPDENVVWDIDEPPKTPKTLRQAPCLACGRWYPIRHSICPDCGAENALHSVEVVGSHYVNMLRLDTGLIEQVRRDVRKAERDAHLRRELDLPTGTVPGTGLIRQMVTRVRLSFANALIDGGVPIYDINIFFRDSETLRNLNFWTKNFSQVHANKMPTALAMRVYKQCQK
ncbi:hypothetical protein BIY29_08610 [Brenneria alni]|uniref:Helicase n=1 Tax=Brenneria alni TaxID=71656 RepID=A0A421DPL7_9GAMM|nr:DEAD/DEAH box helicase family protein [Brenneria alni]RLM24767.1 hypothetical protein BIY29_08610 [Brenneria alni]